MDANSQQLALELRDGLHKSVAVSVIDIPAKEEIYQFEIEEDAWLYSVWGISKGKILLQKLIKEDSPEIEGVMVYDTQTETFLWEMPDVSFLSVQDDIIVIQDVKDANNTFPISLSEGKVLEGIQAEIYKDPISRASFYYEKEEHFSTVSAYIQQKYHRTPVSMIEYLESTGVVIISYYIYLEKKLLNLLLVINEEGEELLHHVIEPEAKGVGFETFYVYNHQLFYIENKTDLTILNLS